MKLLEGKVIVVTGGAGEGSIGEGIAQRCAEHGARVIVTSRKKDAATAAASRLARAGDVEGEALDLTKDADVASFCERVLRKHGRVDGVAHNAGFPVTEWARPFLDVPVDEYARVFDVDVVGAIRVTRALLPRMMQQGSGAFVFTSSTAGIGGYEALHEFAPSKAGVLGIMRDLAAEFGRHGVRSNAVAYGNIASPATYDALTPEHQQALAAESPMRRWAKPYEAAGATVFLLSDLASFVNGQTLIVDGGTLMK